MCCIVWTAALAGCSNPVSEPSAKSNETVAQGVSTDTVQTETAPTAPVPEKPNPKEVKVFSAGYVSHNDDSGYAGYWQNGLWHALTDGSDEAYALTIALSGQDIYAAGYRHSGFERKGGFWKNGLWTELPRAGQNDAYAYGIAFSGSDIYIAGALGIGNNDRIHIAGYWKNGDWNALSDGIQDAAANSVIIVNGSVYICGYKNNGNSDVAGYWKNDIWTAVSDGSSDARAVDLAVSGDDLLIAAWHTSASGARNAVLYRNGAAQVLGDEGGGGCDFEHRDFRE